MFAIQKVIKKLLIHMDRPAAFPEFILKNQPKQLLFHELKSLCVIPAKGEGPIPTPRFLDKEILSWTKK